MRLAAWAVVLVACFSAPAAAVCDRDLGCGAGRAAPTAGPLATLGVQAQASQLGLHSVTQVWAGDVVARNGAVTTYTTNVDRQDAGTYARRVASVATGEGSAYDNVVFNGRRSLSGGQAVAGDVYASYVVRGGQLVLDRYVFFQDDSEVARLGRQRPGPVATPVTSITPTSPPTAAPASRPAPVSSSPSSASQPSTASPAPAPIRPAEEPRPRRTSRSRDVAAGIALDPQGDPLARIEVLRGRAVSLWTRATVDGAPARVAAWRLESGELTALGPVSGSGDQPLVATWREVTRAGSTYSVRLSVDVIVPGQGTRTAFASIEIAVRSPALIQ